MAIICQGRFFAPARQVPRDMRQNAYLCSVQETWTFEIAHPETIAFQSARIKELLTRNQMELGIFLSYYFKKEGAIAEKPEIVGEVHWISPTSGSFVLSFDLVYFNACLNIHEQNRDQMEITFEVGEQLMLKGPYWPERGMDDL